MMVQLLFGVEVANRQRDADESLDVAYATFNLNSQLACDKHVVKRQGDWSKTTAIATSYLTLSRYGDILVRSYEPSDRETGPYPESGYASWRFEAGLILLAFSAGLPALAWLILACF